jgi:hypothetical protein
MANQLIKGNMLNPFLVANIFSYRLRILTNSDTSA